MYQIKRRAKTLQDLVINLKQYLLYQKMLRIFSAVPSAFFDINDADIYTSTYP